MSKRKGTFIRARTYLDHLSADYLRYYYASKFSSAVDDIDLNFEEFAAKVRIQNLFADNSKISPEQLSVVRQSQSIEITVSWKSILSQVLPRL